MSKRQLAMVVDINKCMGCQACTVACKILWTNYRGMDHMWGMKTNTMPGKGSPKDWEKMGGGYDKQGKLMLGKLPNIEEFGAAWEFNYEEVFYGGNPNSRLAPKGNPKWGPNWDEDLGGGEYPNCYYFYLPRLCNQCTHPPCVEACPQDAMIKREEDGVVLILEEKCRASGPCGYECSRACPYKVIYTNSVNQQGQMCNFCLPRYERGVAPACLRQCPGRTIRIGYLDDKDSAVSRLVKEWQVALPLHPEWNTGANIYYVPPLAPARLDAQGNPDPSTPRIPMDYQKSLFGPGVEAALHTLNTELARRRKGENSELLVSLIGRRWTELLGPFPKDPSEVKA